MQFVWNCVLLLEEFRSIRYAISVVGEAHDAYWLAGIIYQPVWFLEKHNGRPLLLSPIQVSWYLRIEFQGICLSGILPSGVTVLSYRVSGVQYRGVIYRGVFIQNIPVW